MLQVRVLFSLPARLIAVSHDPVRAGTHTALDRRHMRMRLLFARAPAVRIGCFVLACAIGGGVRAPPCRACGDTREGSGREGDGRTIRSCGAQRGTPGQEARARNRALRVGTKTRIPTPNSTSGLVRSVVRSLPPRRTAAIVPSFPRADHPFSPFSPAT